jgi:hypothetical protein
MVRHESPHGDGIRVETTATTGTAAGLTLDVKGVGATAAYVKAAGSDASGMRVECAGARSTGLNATAGLTGLAGSAASTAGVGVQGAATDPAGTGVLGLAVSAAGVNYGVLGESKSNQGYGVFSRGRFGATGSKGFVQPHPTDPTRQIFFVCLEGNENGTYFRGTARLAGGRVEIPIPEAWALVTASRGITVQVTAHGPGQLWVESRSRERIVIAGDRDVAFDYFVNGVRRGFEAYEPVEPNTAFVPPQAGRAFATELPPGVRAILIRNGILGADGTPNTETAARLGWKLAAPAKEARR